jgi:homoserine kinase type II
MDSVILLWHIHPLNEGEDQKLIGVYRNSQDAMAAIQRLKSKPGFKDYPDGFQSELYRLNVDHWTDGFRIVQE